MRHSRILVAGGSGFIGTQVVSALSAQGRRVIVPTRRPERARHLRVLPTVEVVQADVTDPDAVAGLLDGCDAVINLVGILHGRPGSGADRIGPDFRRAHVDLPAALVAACQSKGVRRFVQVSALGVTDGDAQGLPSRYLRSKAQGEQVVRHAQSLAWTVLRPSVVFGADDAFLRLFAQIQKTLPLLLLAGAQVRFQPIWVNDLAHALVDLLDAPSAVGKVYTLTGPEVFTLRELVALAGRWSGHARPILGLPESLARLMALLMELAPGEPLMTRDNLDSMRIDNVADAGAETVPGLRPASLRALGPELYGPGREGRLDGWRAQTRRGR